MPGYGIDRFPSLSANEKCEYTCSICQDIFCCPMTAPCCLQTFCEDCIHTWLQSRTTCPYDRKTLTLNGLSRPPRVLMNMLGKLKIRCDFRYKGCKEVVNVEDLIQHTTKCKYNVGNNANKCHKCFCEQIAGHDCIQSLLELNLMANEEIEALKGSAGGLREQQLMREINELKVENNNLLKTIQDLFESEMIELNELFGLTQVTTTTQSAQSTHTVPSTRPVNAMPPSQTINTDSTTPPTPSARVAHNPLTEAAGFRALLNAWEANRINGP